MAPTSENLRNVAEQAERDLNTYEAKTGAHRDRGGGEAGVDTRTENRFPGAEVRYGDDLSTSASYNKRIPPEEGGETDARGRQTRGEHFSGGVGSGPQEKLARQARDYGGYDELDAADRRRPGAGASDATGYGQSASDPLRQGREAAQANVEGGRRHHQAGRGEQFRGSDYYTPESVPGSIAAEGYEAPESVVQASREAEGY
ncbi:hypothetical protein SLS62_006572 [Diatrype stigma]|uniref:Uncharacterized protein n=1 Tax=Diatrype stigma TaxID=117547 RepID=A0AAN9YR40_9PEZI